MGREGARNPHPFPGCCVVYRRLPHRDLTAPFNIQFRKSRSPFPPSLPCLSPCCHVHTRRRSTRVEDHSTSITIESAARSALAQVVIKRIRRSNYEAHFLHPTAIISVAAAGTRVSKDDRSLRYARDVSEKGHQSVSLQRRKREPRSSRDRVLIPCQLARRDEEVSSLAGRVSRLADESSVPRYQIKLSGHSEREREREISPSVNSSFSV